jgi:hypothetical protein
MLSDVRFVSSVEHCQVPDYLSSNPRSPFAKSREAVIRPSEDFVKSKRLETLFRSAIDVRKFRTQLAMMRKLLGRDCHTMASDLRVDPSGS